MFVLQVALGFFTCIVLASCSFGDSYLVGKMRDPYWAHRPYGRSNNRQSSSTTSRNNNRYRMNNRYANSLDNQLGNDIQLKKFFHGNGNSYQFKYPFFDQNRNRDSFGWDYPSMEFINKVKMPKLPPMPSMKKQTQMNSREWPDYIPPIRMIKLPLDEPPAAIN